jgi:uncharacterized iron-regulated protein
MKRPAGRRGQSLALAVGMAAVAWGCAGVSFADPEAARIAQAIAGQPRVLLGEVHDNAAGHALRLAALEQAVATGWRPALAMEQFDREHQTALDAAVARCGQDADCVIQAASPERASWQWAFYRPLVALALQYQLPLVAANLSRSDASRVVREGLPAVFDADALQALHLDAPVPEDVRNGQEAAIDAGHCGKLPAPMIGPMARAQFARDAVMAGLMQAQGGRPVVLVAGNGHVRRDYGVPRWLDAQSVSVGFVESAPPEGRYTLATVVPAATRADPCAAFAPPAR